jgi:pentatricopeptide repeat protein
MRILRTGEEVFELLAKMRKMGCEPTVETYIMLIRKLCRWRDFDNVLLLWDEMKEKTVGPDLSSYIVMIHGLFLNGKIEEAYGYYKEMKDKGMRPNENVEDMIQSWFSGKQYAEQRITDSKGEVNKGAIVKKSEREKNFLQQPEVRKVVREHGYSFWDE